MKEFFLKEKGILALCPFFSLVFVVSLLYFILFRLFFQFPFMIVRSWFI